MKFIYLLLVVLLISCTNSISIDDYSSLAQECQLSGSKDTVQCKIAADSNLTIGEKESALGFYYFVGGEGLQQNCDKAKYWLEQSALKQDKNGLNTLGMMYSRSNLCVDELDYKKAEKFTLLAYDKGSEQAAANLGGLYIEGGYGIDRDIDKAIKWFKLAETDSPIRANNGLAQAYRLLGNEALMYEYTLKAAKLNDAEAQHNLGLMYETGLYIDQDIEKARYWYELSAAQGFPLAFDKLESLSK